MNYEYNDGGRKAAGFEGGVADCVTRALSIISGKPYSVVRTGVLSLAPDADRAGVNVFCPQFSEHMVRHFGATFIPVRYAIPVREFPRGEFIALTQNHVTAISDCKVLDVFDCRDELVRGYWVSNLGGRFDVVDANGAKLNRNGGMTLDQAVKMRDLMMLNYNRKSWIL